MIEETKVITIDDTPLIVDDLSESIKSLITIYDEFRRDEIKAKHELIKVQSAMRDIQREIVLNIKKERAENSTEEKTNEN